MKKNSKIYIAGHMGMVGSAIFRKLRSIGYNNLILKSMEDLDLLDQQATELFHPFQFDRAIVINNMKRPQSMFLSH